MHLPDIGEIHDIYLALNRLAAERFGGDLRGKLLLRVGYDSAGTAVLIAASVAGGASLCVDADAERMREGLRHGLCDFVVAHPDEALRILKNELRRGLPVSVGLPAEPEPCLAEMIDRGVQPDWLSGVAAAEAAIFMDRGAVTVPALREVDPDLPLLIWTVTSEPARSMPRIAQVAADSLDSAHEDTPARRRWLQFSPRYLGRAFKGTQCVRMTVAESSVFETLVHAEVPAATVRRQ